MAEIRLSPINYELEILSARYFFSIKNLWVPQARALDCLRLGSYFFYRAQGLVLDSVNTAKLSSKGVRCICPTCVYPIRTEVLLSYLTNQNHQNGAVPFVRHVSISSIYSRKCIRDIHMRGTFTFGAQTKGHKFNHSIAAIAFGAQLHFSITFGAHIPLQTFFTSVLYLLFELFFFYSLPPMD